MKIKVNSIKSKFILSSILIFFFATVFLNLYLSSLLEKSYSNRIKRDCNILYSSSRDYIYRYAKLQSIDIDQTNIIYLAKSIAGGITSLNPTYIRILDKDLNELCEINKDLERKYILFSDDLKAAQNNNATTTITKINNKYISSFSYGLYFNNNLVAIINFKSDYSYLFEEKNKIIFDLNIIILLIFILFTVIIFYLTTRITNPLYKLINIVERISKGSYDAEIKIESNDEVGILANKFEVMQDNIKENLDTIKNLEFYRRDFFNNVTHELKTPLTGIKLYSELLEQNYNDTDLVITAADRIKKESNRLYSLVENLLEVSKGKISEAQETLNEINIKPIAETILSDMQLIASAKNIKIIDDISDTHVRAYTNHIVQLLINIIDNAIKYSLEGNNVYLSVLEKDGLCNIDIKNSKSNKNVSTTSGNGIGLFIVDSIVTKLSGSLIIKNTLNTFEVNIKIPCL